MSRALTPKQLLFCQHYLLTRNVVQSAISAGYSKTYAEKKGYKLMKNPQIIETIKEAEQLYFTDQFGKLGIKAAEKLERIIDYGENKDVLAAANIIFKSSIFSKIMGVNEEEKGFTLLMAEAVREVKRKKQGTRNGKYERSFTGK